MNVLIVKSELLTEELKFLEEKKKKKKKEKAIQNIWRKNVHYLFILMLFQIGTQTHTHIF